MFPLGSARRLITAIAIVIGLSGAIERARTTTPDDLARFKQGLQELHREQVELAAHRARLKKELEDFRREASGCTGQRQGLPLRSGIVPRDQYTASAARGAFPMYQPSWDRCPAVVQRVGGPSAVSGDKIKIIFDVTTEMNSKVSVGDADEELEASIDGRHTWRHLGENFYLGGAPLSYRPRSAVLFLPSAMLTVCARPTL